MTLLYTLVFFWGVGATTSYYIFWLWDLQTLPLVISFLVNKLQALTPFVLRVGGGNTD